MALNRGRHLSSAGPPSRWALAHILVSFLFSSLCVVTELDAVFDKFMGLLKRDVDSAAATILGRFSVCCLLETKLGILLSCCCCTFWVAFSDDATVAI